MTIEKEYTEGRTTFLSADVDHYSGDKKQPTTSLPVFYNPRMQLNRDLSVLFLTVYMDRHPVELMCEPLTGSGVRTLRYLNECPSDFYAIMCDTNPLAVDIAQRNVEALGFNNRAKVIHGDAKLLLMTESREKRFDFVDVDPFGTPTPYIYAAVQSMSPKGGLLAATATDMPVLCGVHPNIALRRYGGFSARTPFTHEIAVRLLNGFIYSIAGSNDCSIEPLAVVSTDHYVRTWVRIDNDRAEANQQAREMGTIVYCTGCMHSMVIPLLSKLLNVDFDHKREGCTGTLHLAGPLWIGALFQNQYLIDAINLLAKDESQTYHRRVSGILEKMLEESILTSRPYIDLHALCDLYNLTPPKTRIIIQGLKDQGFEVSRTHFKPTAIRTTASVNEVMQIILNYQMR
ncbi:MAG: tRNA (guanine(10)-N(2))-dimethyltransferase [Candidatus Thorarchaeota archaeon SMTZ1-45]